MRSDDRRRLHKFNVAFWDATFFNHALPETDRTKAVDDLVRLIGRKRSGKRTGGKADRTEASAIRRQRLAKLAPLARVVHECLSYQPEGETGLARLSRTRLLDELHNWLWTDAERYDPPEGVSVEAIANDHELWPPVIKRNGKVVKRYKTRTPSRRAFRDLFRNKSVDNILIADGDPAPAEGAPTAR